MAGGDGSHVHEKKNASPKGVGLSPGQCYILVVYSLTGLQAVRAPFEVFAFVGVNSEVGKDLTGTTLETKSTFQVLHKDTSSTPVEFVLVEMKSNFDTASKPQPQDYPTDSNGKFSFFSLKDGDVEKNFGSLEPDAKTKKLLEEACKKYREDLKNKDLAQE